MGTEDRPSRRDASSLRSRASAFSTRCAIPGTTESTTTASGEARRSRGSSPSRRCAARSARSWARLPDFIGGIKPIHVNPPDKWKSNKFEYATFIGVVAREFVPQAIKRGESAGYLWCDWDVIPYPLLPTPRRMIENPRIMSKIRRYVWAMERDFESDGERKSEISSGDVR